MQLAQLIRRPMAHAVRASFQTPISKLLVLDAYNAASPRCLASLAASNRLNRVLSNQNLFAKVGALNYARCLPLNSVLTTENTATHQIREFNKGPEGQPREKIMPTAADPIIKAEFKEDKQPKGAAAQIKQLVRDYGPIAMVVHVTLSLMSLGGCYLAIDYGIPIHLGKRCEVNRNE